MCDRRCRLACVPALMLVLVLLVQPQQPVAALPDPGRVT